MNDNSTAVGASTQQGEPGLAESHRSFVNRWECDENDHWNVQFYSRSFQQAAESLAVAATGRNPGADCAVLRHIRYYSELRGADSIVVHSARIGNGAYAGRILHLMHESQSGRLSATALDSPAYPAHDLPGVDGRVAADAAPRGLDAAIPPVADSAALLAQGTALVTNVRAVRPYELDHLGKLIANEVASRITDGAPHVWHHFGVTTDWMRERGLGRVAVEQKIANLADCAAGDVIRTISWRGVVEGRTFVLHHQLENAANGQVVAASQVRCLVMDHATRKAVELPDALTAMTPR